MLLSNDTIRIRTPIPNSHQTLPSPLKKLLLLLPHLLLHDNTALLTLHLYLSLLEFLDPSLGREVDFVVAVAVLVLVNALGLLLPGRGGLALGDFCGGAGVE